MFLITFMNWSDVAMGDGNPQTMVALRSTREEAELLVVEHVNSEWAPCDEQDNPTPVGSFAEVVEYLKMAPENPELDISEIEVDSDFFYLKRDVLDESPRSFNGRHLEATWALATKRKVLEIVFRELKAIKLEDGEQDVRKLVGLLTSKLQQKGE